MFSFWMAYWKIFNIPNIFFRALRDYVGIGVLENLNLEIFKVAMMHGVTMTFKCFLEENYSFSKKVVSLCYLFSPFLAWDTFIWTWEKFGQLFCMPIAIKHYQIGLDTSLAHQWTTRVTALGIYFQFSQKCPGSSAEPGSTALLFFTLV